MKKLKKFLKILGPGFITGASDDDPSGIATYSQAGAQFGYQQLWTALLSLPFMTTIQEMCGRIGIVTGQGISSILKRHYSKSIAGISVGLLVIANTINIGANLGAMAASFRLLIPVPIGWLLLGFTAITILLEVFLSYKTYAKYLKYLTLSLLAYIACGLIVTSDWSSLWIRIFTPSVSLTKDYLINIIAILGTTISPYLFFWQTSQETEEHNGHKDRLVSASRHVRLSIKDMRLDTFIGMFFSNFVMFFIILTTGDTHPAKGI